MKGGDNRKEVQRKGWRDTLKEGGTEKRKEGYYANLTRSVKLKP